jgi:molybdate transport system regulatory protein
LYQGKIPVLNIFMGKTNTKLIANGRIWVDTEDGPLLGYGRIELLEKIREVGSIRQAAIEMKMSYRQAWQLISQMNDRSADPLVTVVRGGKGGGQAMLTSKGETAIVQFHKFNEAFQEFLGQYAKKLKF